MANEARQLVLGLWQGLKQQLTRSKPAPPPPTPPSDFSITYRRNARARHYIMRVEGPGHLLVTLPRRGTMREARAFIASRDAWIRKQLDHAQSTHRDRNWQIGQPLLWRGNEVPLRILHDKAGWLVRLGQEEFPLTWRKGTALIPSVVHAMRRKATEEFTARTQELASTHGITIRSVTVRDQRSRWGSCSSKNTLSLNWRLLLVPPWVADYVILHELAHTRHFNHSANYWATLIQMCPNTQKAEAWLKAHGPLLREPARE